MKKLLIIICVVVALVSQCGNSANPGQIPKSEFSILNNSELITEIYIVQPGDTLDGIAEKFIVKNTYSERNFKEFKEGIKEINARVFAGRHEHYLVVGEKLTIKYFVKKEGKS